MSVSMHFRLRLLALTCAGVLAFMGSLGAQQLTWYRGNTHCHTTEGNGYEMPEKVAAWYQARGYNFLCISDQFGITPRNPIKTSLRKDFILIPSQELSGSVHATAMNITSPISVRAAPTATAVLQDYKQRVDAAGGILIVNHPNFPTPLKPADILPVKGLALFEVYNCGPTANNEGDAKSMSTEALWDGLLTNGMVIYGIASDDARNFPDVYKASLAGPGKGWVMVQAKELTPAAICDAMVHGRFYSSIGVMLSKAEASPSRITVVIDKAATEAELAKGTTFGRPAPSDAKVGERIDFIGTGGKLLESVKGLSADYTPKGTGYVRARATVTRRVGDKLVEFCAWLQPVFLP
jgi:hypothetical protein